MIVIRTNLDLYDHDIFVGYWVVDPLLQAVFWLWTQQKKKKKDAWIHAFF